MQCVKKYVEIFRDKCKNCPQMIRLYLFFAFLLAWLPYYLTYFPGIVRYDEMLCVQQAMGDIALSNHHPIIFMLYLKIIITVVLGLGGNMNVAVAVATFLQMSFMSAILTETVIFINNRVIKSWCVVFAILFFAFSPIIALYVVVLSKDTFFTGWFILYIISIYKVCNDKLLSLKIYCILITFLFVVTGLARSNGLYVVILMIPILIYIVSEYRKQLLICGTCAILIIYMIKGPIFKMVGVAEPSVAEAFSVPIQQLAYTLACDGEIKEDDLSYLNEILPIEEWKQSYTPGITDRIKFHEEFKSGYLDETSGKFLRVWHNNLFENFNYYVKAYFEQIRGYWDITHIVNVENTDIVENSYGIMRIDVIKEIIGYSLKPLCSLAVLIMRKLPLINVLTNQLSLAVIYVGTFICIMKTSNRKRAVIVVPSLLLWITLLIAAPVSSEFRYMLSFHFVFPIVIWLLCSMNKGEENG